MDFIRSILESFAAIETQNFLSVIAVVIAIAAALYARWAAKAAQRANEIAIHLERLHVFKAARHFQYEIQAIGLEYSDTVQGALIRGTELAEFYFAHTVSEALSKLIEKSQKLINERSAAFVQDACGQPVLPPEARRRLSTLHHEVIVDVKNIVDDLKAHLRLV